MDMVTKSADAPCRRRPAPFTTSVANTMQHARTAEGDAPVKAAYPTSVIANITR